MQLCMIICSDYIIFTINNNWNNDNFNMNIRNFKMNYNRGGNNNNGGELFYKLIF